MVKHGVVATLRSGVAMLYCGLSRLDEARALFEPDAATGFVEFPRDNTWTTSMSFCADTAVVLRDHRAAQVLHEALLPFVDLVVFNGGTVVGAIARPLGRVAHMLGHHSEADAYFRSALATHERLNAPYLIAQTQLDYAELLIERADAVEMGNVKEMVRRALTVSKEYVFGALEQRASVLLASLA